MENTITIRFIEGKTSKQGKQYWQVEDNQGNKYTCFEADLHAKMKAGKTYNMEIVTSEDGRWKNIRSVSDEVKAEPVKSEETKNYEATHQEPSREPQKKAGSWRSPKEIIACELVKIAAEAKILLEAEKVLAAYKKILSEL